MTNAYKLNAVNGNFSLNYIYLRLKRGKLITLKYNFLKTY